MTEKLLHFIWKFRYFNPAALQTVSGESLTILFPGQHNDQQGPDFSQARIRVGKTIMAGSIELHVKTSDWLLHGHSADSNYNNVVLHVVFQHDKAMDRDLPILELAPRIHHILCDRYEQLTQSPSFIPCGKSITQTSSLTLKSWFDRLLAERLQRKATLFLQLRGKAGGYWEEAFWQLLARSFGASTNGEAFEAIARSVPVKLIAKHKNSIHQLEAVLMGQANLVGAKWEDDYAQLLWREYKFLKNKYGLQPVNLPVHFLRMRPLNFPTIRLAQLAALLYKSSHLFSKILETEDVSKLEDLLHATANDYWHYHYRFDELTDFLPKNTGTAMVAHLLINAIAPSLFAYGWHQKQPQFVDRALALLETLHPEKNAVCSGFAKLGIPALNAATSQALLELKNNYCNERRCLECAVGNALLRREMVPQRSDTHLM